MKFVFSIDGKDYKKLNEVLSSTPYDKDSFSTVGFVMKDRKSLGLENDGYILCFKCEDDAISEKLVARLKVLEKCEELKGEEKEKIIAKIEGEEENAAEGFGAIFS